MSENSSGENLFEEKKEKRVKNKTNIKCLGCGGELVYSISHHALFCPNCGRTLKFKAENGVIKKEYFDNLDNQTNNEEKTTNCSSCGAKLKVNNREITKTCPYCSSNFVLDRSEIVGLKPDVILPFALDKIRAIEKYRQNVKKKWFLPNKFKKTPNLDNINGTYISCFIFDSKTHSSYSGTLGEVVSRTSNGKTYTDIKYKHISGKKDVDFENFEIESSSQASQALFKQVKPYQINDETCYHYNENFLRGFCVESNDKSVAECKAICEDEMKSEIKSKILSTYSYSFVQEFNLKTSFEDNKFSYILLPIYFIDFKYGKKDYRVYLNGQTGKLGDNLPKSKVKIGFAIFFGLLLISLFIYLFYLKG